MSQNTQNPAEILENMPNIEDLADKSTDQRKNSKKAKQKLLTFTIFHALMRQYCGRMDKIKAYLHEKTAIKTSEAALLDRLASYKGISADHYLFYPEYNRCWQLLEDLTTSPELRKVCQDFIDGHISMFIMPAPRVATANRKRWLEDYASQSPKSAITSRENQRKKRALRELEKLTA